MNLSKGVSTLSLFSLKKVLIPKDFILKTDTNLRNSECKYSQVHFYAVLNVKLSTINVNIFIVFFVH